MRDKTKQVPETMEERQQRKRNKRVMVTVPAHTEEELLIELGVIIDENKPEVAKILGELDSAMWDSVQWDGEEEQKPE